MRHRIMFFLVIAAALTFAFTSTSAIAFGARQVQATNAPQTSVPTPTPLPSPLPTNIPTQIPISATTQTSMDSLEAWSKLSTIFSDVLLGIAAIVGIFGYNKWRAELTGKAKFEIARKLALVGFQFRHQFRIIRDPFTYPWETQDREGRDNEAAALAQVNDEYFVRLKRLTPLRDVLRNLHEVSWEAEIVLEKDADRLVEPFEGLAKKFYIGFQEYFRIQRAQARDPNIHEENKHWDTVYGQDDEFSRSVNTVLDDLLKELRPFLSSDTRTWLKMRKEGSETRNHV